MNPNDLGPAGAAAFARQRANHTGTQPIDTVEGLGEALDELNPQNNLDANAAPGANDDSTQGYRPLSIWIFEGVTYRCVDATPGAAVWIETGISAEDLGSAAFASTSDFDPAGAAATAQDYAVQRANHTGTQGIETVSGLADALADRVVTGTVGDESVTTSTGTQTVAEALDQRGLVFDSVADMQAAANLTVGTKVRTLGYYSPGDGGGNDYEIVAAGTGTDDGGSYIDLSGSGLQAKGLFGSDVNVKQFGAKGDGVTEDQEAFSYLPEGASTDLSNLKYAVSSVPGNQLFSNGNFVVDGFTRDAYILPNPKTFDPKYAKYGGQLERLRDELMNPLVQFTGIVFVGDSNTWGSGTGESAPRGSRNQTLDDLRDFFGTGTWVNNFKRYIGSNYFLGAEPIISNWHSSPSGESTAEYTRDILLYPYSSYFEETISSSATTSQRERAGSVSGWQYVSTVSSPGTFVSVKFVFTGSEFDMVYTETANGADYEVIVDGVSLGVYTTSGPATVPSVSRTHSFEFVKDKTVEIKVIPGSQDQNTFPMYWEAIRIKKKCRITNNGIIGVDTIAYRVYNLTHRQAVLPDDGYTFVQIGGNDRGIRYERKAGGVAPFFDNLKAMVEAIPSSSQIVMMSPNPGSETGNYSFTRMDVRNIVRVVAKEKGLDFIDNYSCFQNLDFNVYTLDGTHMNVLGNATLTKNLIGSLESS